MKFKSLIATAMAAMTAMTMTTDTFAADVIEPTPQARVANDNNLQEHSFTLSVEDFADFASEYGCSVTIGDEDIAEPQKHEKGSYTFTDNNFHKIGADTPILNEDLQIQNIRFGSNAKSVDVRIDVRLGINPTYSKDIPNGGHSKTFSVPFGCQYRVFMKVNSDVPLSSSNPCTVTYYWTDRGGELL